MLGQTFEILMGNDPVRVEAWLKERKRRFPVTVRPTPALTPAPTTRTSSVISASSASSGKGALDPGVPSASPQVLAATAALISPLSSLVGSGVQEAERKEGSQEIEAQAGSAQSAPDRGANLSTREDENPGDAATQSTAISSSTTSNPFWTLDHPERMRRFYALYQPSKIAQVPLLWQEHQHHPAVMWAALFDKYKGPQRDRAALFVEQTAAPVVFLQPAPPKPPKTKTKRTKRTAAHPEATSTDNSGSGEEAGHKRARTEG